MSEEKQPVVIQGGVMGGVQAGTEVLDKVSKWSAQQVLIVVAVVSLVTTNGLLIWTLMTAQADRKDERRDQKDRTEAAVRSVEEARERDRQFHAIEREKDRHSNMDRDKAIMMHCESESRLQRESHERLVKETNKVVEALSVEVGRLTKKGVEEEVRTAVAPFPKTKVISP